MGWRSQWQWTKETIAAAWRQGVHELGAALYGPGTAAQTPEYGMPWTKMPGEVMQDMKDKDAPGPAVSTNVMSLDERIRQAAAVPERVHEMDKELDRE